MAIEKHEIEVKQLLFDPQNPRLPLLLGKSQKEIFRFLVDEIGVDDVLQSIAASGVIEGDPVIARQTDGRFFVVEGNRRLAALKLLNGEKIGDGGEEPILPALSASAARTVKKITIQTGWAEQDLETYLGYKHVTATREWPPEAKARFVISRVNGDFSVENLTSFAKRLGTSLPTLRRWLVASLTLQQAQAAGRFDPKEAYAKRYFGTFYTLLGSEQVQKFLALVSDPISSSPVPADHISQLEEFIGWSIGTKAVPPVINSRKQQKLNAVLSSPSALQYFRLRRDLDSALLYTEYNAKEISAKLLNAAYGIEECLPKLFDVREDAAVVSAIETLDAAHKKLEINIAEPKNAKTR
jgi:ParB-like nuclease domain